MCCDLTEASLGQRVCGPFFCAFCMGDGYEDFFDEMNGDIDMGAEPFEDG